MQNFILFLFIPFLAYSHSGKLDHNGGHTNHITGKYHLHTGNEKTTKPLDTTIRIQVLKYGGPYSWGQRFSSIERCESKIKQLAKENAGLDLTYICAIK